MQQPHATNVQRVELRATVELFAAGWLRTPIGRRLFAQTLLGFTKRASGEHEEAEKNGRGECDDENMVRGRVEVAGSGDLLIANFVVDRRWTLEGLKTELATQLGSADRGFCRLFIDHGGPELKMATGNNQGSDGHSRLGGLIQHMNNGFVLVYLRDDLVFDPEWWTELNTTSGAILEAPGDESGLCCMSADGTKIAMPIVDAEEQHQIVVYATQTGKAVRLGGSCVRPSQRGSRKISGVDARSSPCSVCFLFR